MSTAMIDELNEDERAMVELVRDFVNREVRPAVASWSTPTPTRTSSSSR